MAIHKIYILPDQHKSHHSYVPQINVDARSMIGSRHFTSKILRVPINIEKYVNRVWSILKVKGSGLPELYSTYCVKLMNKNNRLSVFRVTSVRENQGESGNFKVMFSNQGKSGKVDLFGENQGKIREFHYESGKKSGNFVIVFICYFLGFQ